jgi:lysozyme
MDVSAYQPNIDWPRAQADQGLSFVFIKASEALGPDGRFSQHWTNAKAAGLLRGAYHFFRQAVDARQQAAFFLNCLHDDAGELPPVLDLEDPRAAGPGPLAAAVLTWLQAVEAQLGRKPIIYTGAWWWDAQLKGAGGYPAWTADYPLWVGSYPLRQGVPTHTQIEQGQFAPRMPQGWGRWSLWQYTGDAALVDGITDDRGRLSRVDLDVFNGTPAELRALGPAMPAVALAEDAQP